MTAARVTADHVVVGRDGAPLPAGTAAQLARLPGVDAAAGMLETDVFLLDRGLGWDTPWPAAGVSAAADGALDLRVTSGACATCTVRPSPSATWSRPKAGSTVGDVVARADG